MNEKGSLKHILKSYGTCLELPLNYRMFLHDDEALFFVEEGEIDLFALEPLRQYIELLKSHFSEMAKQSRSFLGDEIQGALNFLLNAKDGMLLMGFNSQFNISKPLIMAIANTSAKIRKITFVELKECLEQHPDLHPELDKYVESWINNLSPIFLYRQVPKYFYRLEIGKKEYKAGKEIAPAKMEEDKDSIVWIQIEKGIIEIAGMQTLTLKEGCYLYPLALTTWLQTDSDSVLSAEIIHPVFSNTLCLQGIQLFHAHVINALFFNKLSKGKAELSKIKQQAGRDTLALAHSMEELGSLFSKEEPAFPMTSPNHIYRACQVIGNVLNLKFTPLPDEGLRKFTGPDDYVYELCLYSHIQFRRVTLPENWWKQELGPLLCFNGVDKLPLALTPRSQGGYEYFIPESEDAGVFEPDLFPSLQLEAFVFYRSFPDKEKLTGRDVARFALKGAGKQLAAVCLFACLSIMTLSLIPFITRQLFGVVIANLDYVVYTQLGLAFSLIAISSLIFNLYREFFILRIQTYLDQVVSAALWQRILTLPIAFFRKRNIGDLFIRSQIIPQVRRILSGSVLRQALNAMFYFIYLLPMFYYDKSLAWTGLTILSIGLVMLIIVSFQLSKLNEEKIKIGGKLNGKIFQALSGISAIRTYGCENRFFADWEKTFFQSKQIEWKLNRWQSLVAATNALLSPLALLAIYGYMLYQKTVESAIGESKLLGGTQVFEVGDFMGFYMAFTILSAAILDFYKTATQLISIKPLYNQSKIFIDNSTESASHRMRPGELTGDVRVEHVFFRYDVETGLILKDVSFYANSGEFIGIVGHSGCGKSTLIRLLVGFETPESGAIYYDGRDLATLDLQEVRKQLGIVLQTSAIIDGTIRDNVVTAGSYDDERIWAVLSLTGIADDINGMPMGLDTVLMNGGNTLSGGQRQRILIARALIGNPKILIFDEATSALDNQTQELISQNLSRLNTTRIVIAHRLSTIRDADRIYVMDQGRIVDSGTFKELAERPGIFQSLLARQKASTK